MIPWFAVALMGMGAVLLSGGREDGDGDGDGDGGGDGDGDGEPQGPRVGLAPTAAARTDIWPMGSAVPADLERQILEAGPVDLEELEAEEPTVGMFYAVRRGDMLIGEGPKSIVWVALYSAAEEAARLAGASDAEIHAFARTIANSPNKRIQYANLIVGGCIYNDLYFSTWAYSPRDFVGVQGRAIVLKGVHADVRQAFLDGVLPQRTLDLGKPDERRTGRAFKRTRKKAPHATHRPYLWLPFLNLKLLWEEHQITTRDCLWPGTAVPCQEPPPEVLRLIGFGI